MYGVFVVATVNAPDVMTDYLSSCTPGYYNGERQASTSEGFLQGHFSGEGVAFYELLREWREQGDMGGLILK